MYSLLQLCGQTLNIYLILHSICSGLFRTCIITILPFLQPSTLCSSTTVLKKQKGTCFEFSILLCSLLIGAGYDAYCVCGYATRETTLMDETREICPMLKKKVEVCVSCLSRKAWER
jgi:hypothetical protein